MCGIIGLIKYRESRNLPDFDKASSFLKHRGPDNYGKWSSSNVDLAVHRLKVHDLSDKANQPYSIKNSNVWLC